MFVVYAIFYGYSFRENQGCIHTDFFDASIVNQKSSYIFTLGYILFKLIKVPIKNKELCKIDILKSHFVTEYFGYLRIMIGQNNRKKINKQIKASTYKRP